MRLLKIKIIVSTLLMFFAGVLFAQTGSAPTDTGRVYRLQDFVEIALENSPGILAAEHGVAVAENAADAARWERAPKLHAALLYENFPWRDKLVTPRHMDIPAPGVPMLPFFQKQFVRNVYNFGGGLSFPLYTGGRLGAQIAAANYSVEAAEENAQLTEDDLKYQLAETYYKILQAKKMVLANRAAVENLRESKRIVEKALEFGKAAPLDVYRITARLANVEQMLIKAEFMEKRAYTRLNVLLGEPDLGKTYPLADELAYEAEPVDLEASLAEAEQRNPMLQSAQAMLEMQKRKRGVAKSMLIPNLHLVAAYRGVLSEKHDTPIGDGMINLAISFPLIDGTVWNNLAKESAAVRQAEANYAQARLMVAQRVRSAYLDVLEAEKRVAAAQAALEQARESLRIEQLKLETGKGIVNDVLDAQADQLNAEVNYIQALADHRIAKIALQRAIGRVGLEL